MSGHTTMKRDGGWTVELTTPVGGVNELNIQPTTLDHSIRWGQHKIPSVLALLSELSRVPEPVLRRLSGSDADRVLTVFSLMAPPLIQKDFQEGKRPLATPDEVKTQEQQYDDLQFDNDPIDPRFPRVEGDVKRFKQPPEPPPAPPTEEAGGVDINPPETMRKVG